MKTLIVYATKHGSSEACAKILSDKLTGEVDQFNLKRDKIPELIQYDQIIIGGSIYIGKIQKEVRDFCIKYKDVLENKRIGLFISCMQVGEMAETQLINSFPEYLLHNAITKAFFGGKLVLKRMNLFERLIIKMVTKNDKSLPEFDVNGELSMLSNDSIEIFAKAMNNA